MGAADGDGYLCRDVHVLKAVCSQRRATARMTSPSSTIPRPVVHAVEGVVEQHMCSSSSIEKYCSYFEGGVLVMTW